jgi:hypothetical protein
MTIDGHVYGDLGVAQIAETIIRRHRGEVLTLVHQEGGLLSGKFRLMGVGDQLFVTNGQGFFLLGLVREIFPEPLTRQQIQEFYEEHGVPQEVRYA